MSKKQVLAIVVPVLMATATAYVRSESFQEKFSRNFRSVSGWSETDRQEDPVGFLNYVETQLHQDLGGMQKTRRGLSGQLTEISNQEQDMIAREEYAGRVAEEFRMAWKNQEFPATICNGAYTRDQAESQVSILLAQIDGYGENLCRIRDARQRAEKRIQQLTVQIVRSETHLALIGTQRELISARQLTATSDELVGQVDALFLSNQTLINASPVRSVEDLISSEGSQPSTTASNNRVREFLTAEVESTGLDGCEK